MSQRYPDDEKIHTELRQAGRMKVPIGFQIALILLVLIVAPVGAYKWLTQAPQITFPTGVTIVTGVQRIGKLETVSNTFQQVIKYDPNGDSFWNFINDPKKLFVVYGTVVAGIDFSTITKNDVIIQTKDSTHASVTLNLPAPQIMSSTVDPNHVVVYDISGGILAPFDQNMDPNVVEKILAGAKAEQQTDACQNHILQQASDSAQVQLTSFLTTLGFTSATVNIAPGTCS